jgi:hypothetical protein
VLEMKEFPVYFVCEKVKAFFGLSQLSHIFQEKKTALQRKTGTRKSEIRIKS